MKISTKLPITFVILAGFGILIGIIGLIGMLNISESYDAIVDETTPELIILGNMNTLSQQLQTEILRHHVFSDESEYVPLYDEELNRIDQIMHELDQEIIRFEKIELFEDGKPEFIDEEDFLTDIRIAKKNMHDSAHSLISALDANSDLSYVLELQKDLEKKGTQFDSIISARLINELGELEQKNIYADRISAKFTVLVLISTVFGLTLAVILGFVVSKKLSKPLEHLAIASEQVRTGKYEHKLVPHGDDEMKNIVNSFNFMVEELDKQKEKLLRTEKLYTIGKLASRLAHDLRNPLSVIQGSVDLLRMNKSQNKDNSVFLARIDTAISRMVYQIESVLDYVKYRTLKLEKFSVAFILDSVLKDLEIPDSITIKKTIHDSEIICDLNMLKVLFINLITNAIQAIHKEKGTVMIRIFDGDKDTLRIEIEDSGSGIDDDVVSHIFEPLFTTKQEGTGLGLTSCKSIVSQHGGNIQIKTNPTIFVITLPKKPNIKSDNP